MSLLAGSPRTPSDVAHTDDSKITTLEILVADDVLHHSTYEALRDAVLQAQSSKAWSIVMIVYILCVIADGAFFFFLLIGLTTISPVATRDYWYNWSLQVLCGLFTWGAFNDAPWRIANFLQLHARGNPKRTVRVGVDMYGEETDLIWFHIPLQQRSRLLVLLLLNIVSQLINQAMRIIYHTYELQQDNPGSLLVNVFFVGAFLFAISGAIYQLRLERAVHDGNPARFSGQDKIREGKKMFKQFRQSTKEMLLPVTSRCHACCCPWPNNKYARRACQIGVLVALLCLVTAAFVLILLDIKVQNRHKL